MRSLIILCALVCLVACPAAAQDDAPPSCPSEIAQAKEFDIERQKLETALESEKKANKELKEQLKSQMKLLEDKKTELEQFVTQTKAAASKASEQDAAKIASLENKLGQAKKEISDMEQTMAAAAPGKSASDEYLYSLDQLWDDASEICLVVLSVGKYAFDAVSQRIPPEKVEMVMTTVSGTVRPLFAMAEKQLAGASKFYSDKMAPHVETIKVRSLQYAGMAATKAQELQATHGQPLLDKLNNSIERVLDGSGFFLAYPDLRPLIPPSLPDKALSLIYFCLMAYLLWLIPLRLGWKLLTCTLCSVCRCMGCAKRSAVQGRGSGGGGGGQGSSGPKGNGKGGKKRYYNDQSKSKGSGGGSSGQQATQRQ
ncbi:unnamed protein product [Vitrella brassicaformis CCMP3155]|uniref:Uncharacterized protein n=2 Tax=Vitrella brassicaformis TaxID=1169539 RepID=A0A0G4EMC4_VITBC|nr:unnamed protein product [Vitrella brassicaformis CCMP3155]|eukprot:CEL98108.1 unnamed protein product [Vitrella brassicaformis CCMP3155]